MKNFMLQKMRLHRLMQPATARSLGRDRHAAVTMMFSCTVIPLVLLIGIAFNFAWIMQARSQLNLAADSAAIAAARQAAALYSAGYGYNGSNTYSNYIPAQFGNSAATQWWTAQTGNITVASNVQVTNPTSIVQQSGQIFTATVNWTAHVTEVFPNLLAWSAGYALIGNTSIASITVNQYGAIDILMDNTSSMMLAVDTTNQSQLQTAIKTWLLASSANLSAVTNSAANGLTAIVNGAIVSTANLATTPSADFCAFACHWSSSGSSLLPTDYYWVARAANVTLRFDTVRTAAISAIDNMKSLEAATQQLTIGVFAFGGALAGTNSTSYTPYFQTIYGDGPIDTISNGVVQAGAGATAAEAAINSMSPPTSTDLAETNFSYAINGLLYYQSQHNLVSGTGGTQISPKRAVIIVTDGIEDDAATQVIPTTEGPISPSVCSSLKNNNMTVYVLYTTYLSNTVDLPFGNIYLQPYITGTSSGDLLPNLTACASSSSDIIQASSISDINSAMQSLVAEAVGNAVKLTN